MPNHVINIIDVEEDYEKEGSENFEDIVKSLETKQRKIDFETLIPYPEKYKEADEAYQQAEEKGVSYKDRPEDGFNHGGYEWCIKNWGTKWNAYGTRVSKYSKIVFQTAWNHPFPVIKKLSKKFPNTTFNVGFADEDIGSNLGTYKIKNGKILHEGSIEGKYTEEDQLLAKIFWAAEDFEN